MNECDIGMLSTVLIGNSNTFVQHGLMVTPRGYANKYAVEDGERNTHDGEQAGRSLSTGLNGWMASIQASGKSAAELAVDYIACRKTTSPPCCSPRCRWKAKPTKSKHESGWPAKNSGPRRMLRSTG
jgi:hypothetical protein